MGLISKALTLLLPLLSVVNAAEILSASNSEDVIPSSYIVVMKDGISRKVFDTHRARISSIHNGKRDAILGNTFNVDGLKGYSGTFNEATIREIASDPAVKYIEHDQMAKALGLIEQPGAGWNLVRISHRQRGTGTSYVYDESAGQGISVCIVDTGIDTNLPEFGGRAIFGANFANDRNNDENGHGNFVASVIAGTRFGVAKKATVIGVKVLDASGAGATSKVISGINWCVENARQRGALGKTVLNISLGGAYSRAVNEATENAVRAGLFVSVAVGGSNTDSRNESPASAQGVCAIAASTMDDQPAPFSNYGMNVAIYAPGTSIQGIGRGGNMMTLSGTSFAAAHASGVGAYLLALENISGNRVCARLKELGTPVIRNPKSGTTNLLLYNGSGR